jgi:glutamine---fructose-6-phosphate transaminase (isomerizing)
MVMSQLSPGREFLNAKGAYLRRSPAKIAVSSIRVQKGEHRHFMVKEMYDQPRVVGQTLAQYIDVASGTIKMPKAAELDFRDINRVSITACGTAFYAGLIARYWFERYAGLPVDIDIAPEFRYRNVPFDRGNLAIFVSQSGETADTLASLEFAKARGARPFGCERARLDSGTREPNRVADTRRPGDRRGFHQGVHLSTGEPQHSARAPVSSDPR